MGCGVSGDTVKQKGRPDFGQVAEIELGDGDRPAPLCSAYDADCGMVTDPAWCWAGGLARIGKRTVHVDPADGYCPRMFAA